MARRLPSHVDLDDLVSAGLVGLTEAVGRYDGSRPERFDAYVQQRVTGAIRDELRALDPLTRDQRRQTQRMQRAERALCQTLGRLARSDEVAEALGMGLDDLYRVRETQAASQPRGLEPGEARGEESEDICARAADSEATAQDESLDHRRVLRRLVGAIETLPDRLRLVLSLYYSEGLLLTEIGLVMGFSEARACQLHREALGKLRIVMSEAAA